MESNGVKKKKAPKHMEKMLFINYKEDQMLQEKLDEIHVESRIREIELDHERLNVKKEWRASCRKKIPVDSLGHASTTTKSPVLQKKQMIKGSRKPVMQSTPSQSRPQSSKDSDNVNAYLLGEYRRMSEVIPSILLALSKKDEKGKIKTPSDYSQQVLLNDSPPMEPDLYRITKLARAVKTMRQNLAYSHKIDMNRPRMSLSRMFKDIHQNRDETNQYTDGTCVLLKRKLEKRRRQSMPDLENPVMGNNRVHHANRLSKVHSAPVLHTGQPSHGTLKRHSIATTGIGAGASSEVGTSQRRLSQSGSPIKRQTSLPAPSLHVIEQEESSDDDDDDIVLQENISPNENKNAPIGRLNMPVRTNEKLLPKRRSLSTTIRPTISRDTSPLSKRSNLDASRGLSRSATNLSSSSESKQFIDEDEFRARQRVALEWKKYDRLKQKIDRFLVVEG
ncbi:hypothetical protein FSP39_014085 [Pinctada imbricata]|uniref:Uncharacterized protein n=1 Tax=Pinctada imbricata TaxID=66713 RepID=A0AA88YJ80_PINIB|nr:hypothetical protein FSP39_014085 [Pinctada imbricata]